MICWNETLYFGDSIKKTHRRVIRAIDRGKKTYHVYCIAFASNPKNLFDILPANELRHAHYQHVTTHILGLAKGKKEVNKLVASLIKEIYDQTGDFRVREYYTDLHQT